MTQTHAEAAHDAHLMRELRSGETWKILLRHLEAREQGVLHSLRAPQLASGLCDYYRGVLAEIDWMRHLPDLLVSWQDTHKGDR